jgi:hypothetical protein
MKNRFAMSRSGEMGIQWCRFRGQKGNSGQVLSRKGKNLGGPYKTLEEAKKRLRQVEFFKHRKAPR